VRHALISSLEIQEEGREEEVEGRVVVGREVEVEGSEEDEGAVGGEGVGVIGLHILAARGTADAGEAESFARIG
jgi:hypothetical protein